MNPSAWLAVSLGGALGSALRYGVAVGAGRLFGTHFPWGTLFINVTASFVLGAVAELFALRWQTTPDMRLLLVVGVCGGYSTFSTFSLDAVTLMNRGATAAAAAYMIGSVVLSVAALAAALKMVRALAT